MLPWESNVGSVDRCVDFPSTLMLTADRSVNCNRLGASNTICRQYVGLDADCSVDCNRVIDSTLLMLSLDSNASKVAAIDCNRLR